MFKGVRILVLLNLVLAAFFMSPSTVTRANALETGAASRSSGPDHPQTGLISPEGYLNPDGTLNLDGTLTGSFDLTGWDVRIDSSRGPVFSPPESGPSVPAVSPTTGYWEDLGYGGGALDNHIFAVATDGTNVYVGGWIVDVDDIPEADYVARWNGSSWSALGSDGNGNGSISSGAIYALTLVGSDLYVGGIFFNVSNNGTTLTAGDQIVRWDGANWHALGSNGAGNGSLNSAVYDIAVQGSDLIVGGQFININNGGATIPEADYIARWDGSDWSALGGNGAGNGSLNSSVYAVAVIGSDIYAGGLFTDVNNDGSPLTAADYVARWDGSDWFSLGSNGAGNGSLSGNVTDLEVIGTDLYVSGIFANVNNGGSVIGAADYLARWNGSSWFSVGSNGAGNGSLTQYVTEMSVSGTELYVTGYFQNVNNGGAVITEADYIAKWDGANWSALGGNGAGESSFNYGIHEIASSGSYVVVGGPFYGVNNNGTVIGDARLVAQWDGSDWSALGQPQGAIVERVFTVAVSGLDVYVGGYFQNVSNDGIPVPAADYLARWDGADWHAVGAAPWGDGSVTGTVMDIEIAGTDVYIAGNFGDIIASSGYLTAADNVAKWDGSDWSALGQDGTGEGVISSQVNVIEAVGTDVYIGGYFTDIDPNGIVIPEADYVAKWDGANWSALGSNGAGNGSLNSTVLALHAIGSDLYVGGWFSNISNNGTPLPAADYLARWNGSSWSAVGSGPAGDGSLNSSVTALESIGTDLYVGGNFGSAYNGAAAVPGSAFIARWNGSTWSALGGNGSGGSSLSNGVTSLAVHGTDLYVGGYFRDVNNDGSVIGEADSVAKWDGLAWSALGSDGAGDGSVGDPPTAYVNSLAVNSAGVYIGGDFFNVNNGGTPLPYADNVAVFKFDSPFTDVLIGGVLQDSYDVQATDVLSDSYPSTIDGPVQVLNASTPVFTSLRTLSGGAFDELAGYPANDFSTEYWFPFYDHGYPSLPGSSMRTWVLIGNTDDSLTADVELYIGGALMGSYSIPPGSRVTPRWIGVKDGPVRVVSTNSVNILASERVFTVPSSSFNEFMGFPADEFTTEYWFPWYDNVNMSASILVGNTNPSTSANVDIYIAGALQGSYVIAANDTLVQTYPGIVNGPVRVVATNGIDIVASQASLSGTNNSYNEIMGHPFDQFDTEYWFPYYDHGYPSVGGSNMRTWVLVGNPSASLSANVEIYIDGVLQGSYTIAPGNRVTPRWIGLIDGPVLVTSDIPIFASERVFTAPSNAFNEMMGYPESQLTTEYWFPWYDSVNMDTDVFIGRP